MPSIDLPLDDLRTYAPDRYPPLDLAEYWASTIEEARAQPLGLTLHTQDPPLRGVRIFAVAFDGFESGRVAGWYVRPRSEGIYPGVVVYHGYSGRAPRPLELYLLAAQGIAVLSIDCRGQNGASTDEISRTGGHVAGWMTQGIRSPTEYYYRYVYADSVRALEVLCSFDEVDEDRVAVTGFSQGGGLSLAAAALSERPAFCWADLPSMCDFPRAIQIAQRWPYTEIADFLRSHPAIEADVWRTLSYVDLLNLASSIKCPVVVSVGLWDEVCPPSTIFGVFRYIASPQKDLRILPYHRHENSYEIDVDRLMTLVRAVDAASSVEELG